MADYYSSGVWWRNGPDEESGCFDAKRLPLSHVTLEGLQKWQEAYDSQLNSQNFEESQFFSEQELKIFDQQGIALWKQVRQELSPEYEIWYFSQYWQQTFTDPSQVPRENGLFA